MSKIKKSSVVLIFTIVFSMLIGVTAFAQDNRVIDNGELLNSTEKVNLQMEIEKLIEEYDMDVVILTVNGVDGKNEVSYADDYYEDNGYGIGEDHSGLLLLIDMVDRNVVISTEGKAIEYFNDSRIESMLDNIVEYLGDDDVYRACQAFLQDVKYWSDLGVEEGQYIFNETDNTMRNIMIGLVAAAIASVATCGFVIHSYKNANSISTSSYVNRESIKVVRNRDMFVNTFTTKTKIQRDNGNSGSGGARSTTHTSSSGRSHGGGSRKF